MNALKKITSDEILMKKIKDGNLDESAILFKRYQVKVFNYFLRLTYDEQHSMDLSQNTFLRMLKYRNSFNIEQSFKCWLFGIARNVYLDSTKSKHSKTGSLDSISKQPSELNYAMSKFENEVLYNALDKLNKDERDIIVMSRFQNMKYSEIAEIQNLSVSAIKVKVHRAIKKLREFYFKDDVSINIQAN